MKLIARFLAVFAVLATVAVAALPHPASATPFVFADAKAEICKGIGATSGASGCNDKAATEGVNRVVSFAVNMLSIVAGIAAVIMIIIAGLKYITSKGEASNISSAKTSLLYEIVGIVIVVISQFLVQYVISKVR